MVRKYTPPSQMGRGSRRGTEQPYQDSFAPFETRYTADDFANLKPITNSKLAKLYLYYCLEVINEPKFASHNEAVAGAIADCNTSLHEVIVQFLRDEVASQSIQNQFPEIDFATWCTIVTIFEELIKHGSLQHMIDQIEIDEINKDLRKQLESTEY